MPVRMSSHSSKENQSDFPTPPFIFFIHLTSIALYRHQRARSDVYGAYRISKQGVQPVHPFNFSLRDFFLFLPLTL